MSENKDNKLTLIKEKTANDYLTHTFGSVALNMPILNGIIFQMVFGTGEQKCGRGR